MYSSKVNLDFFIFFETSINYLIFFIYSYITFLFFQKKEDYLMIKIKYIIYSFYNFRYNEDQKKFEDTLQKSVINIDWVDIWEFNTKISSLESHHDLPWHMYYKYKLSMFNTWHVLEDRIAIFFVFIIYCL